VCKSEINLFISNDSLILLPNLKFIFHPKIDIDPLCNLSTVYEIRDFQPATCLYGLATMRYNYAQKLPGANRKALRCPYLPIEHGLSTAFQF